MGAEAWCALGQEVIGQWVMDRQRNHKPLLFKNVWQDAETSNKGGFLYEKAWIARFPWVDRFAAARALLLRGNILRSARKLHLHGRMTQLSFAEPKNRTQALIWVFWENTLHQFERMQKI